jgi:hypothetical protein
MGGKIEVRLIVEVFRYRKISGTQGMFLVNHTKLEPKAGTVFILSARPG